MRCMIRMASGRVIGSTTFHLDAHNGVTWCQVCKRHVYRGLPARQLVAASRRRWDR
jgi:hypothetical protein